MAVVAFQRNAVGGGQMRRTVRTLASRVPSAVADRIARALGHVAHIVSLIVVERHSGLFLPIFRAHDFADAMLL